MKSIGNRICKMHLMLGKEWLACNLCSNKAVFITGENICINGGQVTAKAKGYAISDIAEITGLTTEEIERL